MRDPVLRALFVVGVAVAGFLLSDVGSLALRVRLFWLSQVVLDILFVLFSARLAKLVMIDLSARQFWRWIAIAGLFFTVGDIIQSSIAFRPLDSTAHTGATVPLLLVSLGVLVAVVAMLRHPMRVSGGERVRWWLDAATIMVAAAAFIWYFVWTGPGVTDPARVGIVLFSSGLMLVSAFSLIKLLLGGNAPFTRAAGIAGGVSASLIAVGTAFGSLPDSNLPRPVMMGLRLLPLILLAATPRIQEIQVRADPEVLARRPRRPYSRLPYAAVAATQILLVGSLFGHGLDTRSWGVLIAVVADTALVIARQLVAFADNAHLLANLDSALLSLRQQEQRFRSMIQNTSDLTLLADRTWTIRYASPAAHQILGLSPEELVGTNLRQYIVSEDRTILDDVRSRVLAEPRSHATVRLRAQHTDGSQRWLELIDTNRLDDPSVASIIGNLRDVSQAHALEEKLRYEATHDSLTKLANRTLLDTRMRCDPALGQFPDEPLGMLIVDLNDFKDVNDTFGHDIGDELLAAVAGRLRGCVRPADTVARIGGDEFAVLLPGAGREQATAVAQRIDTSLSGAVTVDGLALTVRASIGVAVGVRRDAGTLLRVSDEAMYEAKRRGLATMVRVLAG